jgi:flagellar hook assembly protein FlgD
VRTLVDGPVSAGRHEVAWDGRDESATVVAAGVYFARLQAPGGIVRTIKVQRLR